MLWRWLFLGVIAILLAENDAEREARVVLTSQGPVRGYKDPATNVFVFQGIPYATAPTGVHKFKAPLPAPSWSEILDASDDKLHIVCPQNIYNDHQLEMKEDCLVASVYVPNTDEKNLPVVVYVHGGGFFEGFGDSLTPKELIKNRGAVAVTFNYRLGIHGFLCLGTDNVPGNAGLKDQALLRWVKRNIATFGGNPEDITIAGYSAGSASVDLLLLSETTSGLINKVIQESGSSIAGITLQMDPLENAKNFARQQNFEDVEDVYALESFFTSAPYSLLTLGANFVPCLERPTDNELFLGDLPLNILKSRNFPKLPLLSGFANMEGLLMMNSFPVFKDEMNNNFGNFLPNDLRFESEEQRQNVGNKVKEFYFGSKGINEETILSYIAYFSDRDFTYPTLRAAKLQLAAGNNDIYLYEYTFAEEGGTPTGYKNITVDGAPHCAQTGAVLDSMDYKNISQEYREMRETIRQLWYNFITTGKPVPEGSLLSEWPPMGTNWSPHMALNNPVELKGPLLKEHTLFWDSIYDQFYSPPIPPPSPPPRQ